ARLRQAKLRRLLDQVHRVCACGPKGDHRCIAHLRLQQEGAEIGGSEWRAHTTDALAAELFDRRNAITLKRMPEGEVRGKEKPFFGVRPKNGFHRTSRRAIGI